MKYLKLSACLALGIIFLAGTLLPATGNPFDDLSAEEINSVVSIIRNSGLFDIGVEFAIVRTQEPAKADWLSGVAVNHRQAYVAVFESARNVVSEVVIDLRENLILQVGSLEPGIAPPQLDSESALANMIIRSDLRWQEAVLRRGVLPDEVGLSTWCPGPRLESETGPDKRILRGLTSYRAPGANFLYWNVLEGIYIVVDLVSQSVIEFQDLEIVNITSTIEALSDYSDKPPLRPLTIEQPEGPSIQVLGQEITWYKWRMRYNVDPIYGLQLHHIVYQADCQERSVAYKISLGEMLVPYGAPGKNWRWRNALDAGEYGMGKGANQLKRGLDVPENALLLPCTIASSIGGDPFVIQGCVGAFERDIGVLFKHQDWSSDGEDADVRRGRQMILTLTATIGNYDYSFDYVFHMDGVIEVKARLTGIVLPKGVSSATNEPDCLLDCLSLLSDYLTAPTHQHFFNYRIDMDVDGVNNYVAEVNVTPDPVGTDPLPWDYGMFSPKKSLLGTETFRDHDFQQHRSWHVLNANSRNNFGSPRGYALKAGDALAYTYLTEENPFFSHATFVQHPFWVTKYKDEEQYPLAKFPRQGNANEGLPEYVSDAESLENEDSVLWYTFGITHTTRPEEWPIMNVHFATGFSLVPYNFLSQNSEMALKDKCP